MPDGSSYLGNNFAFEGVFIQHQALFGAFDFSLQAHFLRTAIYLFI